MVHLIFFFRNKPTQQVVCHPVRVSFCRKLCQSRAQPDWAWVSWLDRTGNPNLPDRSSWTELNLLQNFFVFQDKNLKFSASFWIIQLWNLTKYQPIQTTFIPSIEECCLNICLNELKFCKVSWNPKSNRILDKQKKWFPRRMWSVPCTMDSFFLQPTDAVLSRNSPSIYGTALYFQICVCLDFENYKDLYILGLIKKTRNSACQSLGHFFQVCTQTFIWVSNLRFTSCINFSFISAIASISGFSQ